MNISILGTRGIPNRYGGFERCAEKIGEYFVKHGHNVTVYSIDEHPYSKERYKGIKIKKMFARESKFGIWGTFIYDYLCLKDALRQDVDIILELGYVPSALFFGLKKGNKARLFTNMDGMEWTRSKWNKILKNVLKFGENRAVSFSDGIIADNPGIQEYYKKAYGINACYIPYGADVFSDPVKSVLYDYNVEEYSYYLLMARLEPENNIETILDGYIESNVKYPFLVIGNYKTKYGLYLYDKYSKKNVRFLGTIFNYSVTSTLRWFSKFYFHGHSVGGTNPSLLEAMASRAFIVAHDNKFNRYVLGDGGIYFKTLDDIVEIIKNEQELRGERDKFVAVNLDRIQKEFNWEVVGHKYLELFKQVV